MREWKTNPDFDQVDFDRRKLVIETLLGEYEQDIKAYAEWYAAWKAKRPQGFRAVKRRAVAKIVSESQRLELP